jgi:hypothetical protein
LHQTLSDQIATFSSGCYVQIEDELWNQGRAIVNAEIKKRLAEFRSEAPDDAAFTGAIAATEV